MRQALRLAMRGYGTVSPNPMVGALVISGEGQVLGKGWHARAGQPHAEPLAIQDAMRKGSIPSDATLYVTLEPCSTHGRTPPCVKAILDCGIKRVVVASLDPNPQHQGAGIQALREAGVETIVGIDKERADQLNEAFFHWIENRTPWVIAKSAMSLDGKIATRTGQSKWITSSRSRSIGMRLRLGSDAIMVGVGTILADDPLLNCRLRKATSSAKKLTRVILDPRLRTPLNSQVVLTAGEIPTLVVTSENVRQEQTSVLEEMGVQILKLPEAPEALQSDQRHGISLKSVLSYLGERGITQLMIEGGGETLGRAFDQNIINRIHFFYAPIIIGGSTAPKAVGGAGARSWNEMLRLTQVQWRNAGPDSYLKALVKSKISQINI